jgi:uncharacterized protein YjbJ (UPF0337 family)
VDSAQAAPAQDPPAPWNRRACLDEAGFDCHVSKPASPDKLLQLLRDHEVFLADDDALVQQITPPVSGFAPPPVPVRNPLFDASEVQSIIPCSPQCLDPDANRDDRER